MENYEHPFSWEALTRIVAMGIIVLLCWKALAIFPIVIIAFVLAASFYPVVKKLQTKTSMPLIACIFCILILPIIPFIVLGFLFIPRVIVEVPILLTSLNSIIGHSPLGLSLLNNFNLVSLIKSHIDYANTTVSIALVIFSIISTIVLAFFLMYDFERLFELFLHVVPTREKGKIKELLEEVALVTGKYIRGNVIISGICGVVIFAGLSILSVPFALPLAIFAAILDLLPLVGQTIGAIPAIIIGFGVSPLVGLFGYSAPSFISASGKRSHLAGNL